MTATPTPEAATAPETAPDPATAPETVQLGDSMYRVDQLMAAYQEALDSLDELLGKKVEQMAGPEQITQRLLNSNAFVSALSRALRGDATTMERIRTDVVEAAQLNAGLLNRLAYLTLQKLEQEANELADERLCRTTEHIKLTITRDLEARYSTQLVEAAANRNALATVLRTGLGSELNELMQTVQQQVRDDAGKAVEELKAQVALAQQLLNDVKAQLRLMPPQAIQQTLEGYTRLVIPSSLSFERLSQEALNQLIHVESKQFDNYKLDEGKSRPSKTSTEGRIGIWHLPGVPDKDEREPGNKLHVHLGNGETCPLHEIAFDLNVLANGTPRYWSHAMLRKNLTRAIIFHPRSVLHNEQDVRNFWELMPYSFTNPNWQNAEFGWLKVYADLGFGKNGMEPYVRTLTSSKAIPLNTLSLPSFPCTVADYLSHMYAQASGNPAVALGIELPQPEGAEAQAEAEPEAENNNPYHINYNPNDDQNTIINLMASTCARYIIDNNRQTLFAYNDDPEVPLHERYALATADGHYLLVALIRCALTGPANVALADMVGRVNAALEGKRLHTFFRLLYAELRNHGVIQARAVGVVPRGQRLDLLPQAATNNDNDENNWLVATRTAEIDTLLNEVEEYIADNGLRGFALRNNAQGYSTGRRYVWHWTFNTQETTYLVHHIIRLGLHLGIKTMDQVREALRAMSLRAIIDSTIRYLTDTNRLNLLPPYTD